MKPINLLPFLSLLLLLAPSSGNAAGSMLRIACDGSNKGADVEVNGKFKGQCPLDLHVPVGTVNLKVRQVIDDLEERVFEENFRIGDGVVKKVDIELGLGQLSEKGMKYIIMYQAAAFREVEQRALSGDMKAMMEIAEWYERGRSPLSGRNYEKQVLWLRKAADAGHPKAMQKLASFYEEGKAGLPKSEEKTLAWRLRAAEAGDTVSMLELEFVYKLGEGVQNNVAQGDFWVQKCAETYLNEAKAGDPVSMKEIGLIYFSGKGIVMDRDEGLKWLKKSAATFRKLADAGDRSAMISLSAAVFDEKGEKMSADQKQYWSNLSDPRPRTFDKIKELRAFVRQTEGVSK